MKTNELTTTFVFNDRDGSKIDLLHKKFIALDSDINNFGKNTSVGKTIANDFETAGKSVDNFKNKINETIDKPTISRHWENETDKVVSNISKIETQASQTIKKTTGLINAGAESLKRIGDLPSALGGKETPIFAEKYKSAFIDLENRSKNLASSFQKLAESKNNKGQFDSISQGAIGAEQKVIKLTRQIKGLKKEAADPANAKLGKHLAEDLKIAEAELNRYERKFTDLNRQQRNPGNSRNFGGGKKRGLTDFDRSLLEVADDFAPAGLNRPFNAVGRELLAVNAISLTTLATFGAIAAAGYLIVDASSKIREQSEKRLLNEQLISGAINKQVIGLRDAFSEYEKFKRSLEKDESFSNRLSSAVNTSDAGAVKREREKIDTDNKSRIEEINRLQADLAQKERSLEFAKSRPVNQGLFTTLGIGREYTASQKQQDVAEAERAVEKTRKALAESETALEKGKSNLQQTDRSLIDIRDRQNKAFSDRFETFQKSQKDSQQFEIRQFEELEKKKKKIAETRILRAEFNSFAVDSIADKNPFIKLFADSESAGERMEKRFKNLGAEYVKLATEIERNNIAKKINEASYDSGKKALNFEQDAVRVSRIRNDQFASFERALDTVEKKVEFAVKTIELDRKIDESYFYAARYNPNNPKSFDESRFSFAQLDRFGDSAGLRRRGESVQEFERRRREAILSGIRVNDAFDEIGKLKNLSLEGTGIFGQGMIADKILERLPSREDLLTLLSSPYAAIRGKAQSLLNEQTNAFGTKRELEQKKLNDFLYDQETAGLNRKFAYDQISLLNNQKGLTRGEYAQNFLDITKSLGNDLDPYLRRGQYEQNLIAAKEERAKQAQALDYWRSIALATAALNKKLDAVITANGLKIDDSDFGNNQAGSLDITVRDQTKYGISTGASGTQEDLISTYFEDLFR